jgi:DNA topoisomerase-1
LEKTEDEIVLDDVIPFIKNGKQSGSSIIKQLNENISIRKGKYGPYVFYKTDKMKKPRFINMKGKSIEDITVSWVTEQL